YTFAVTGYNAAGDSDYSDTASATTTDDEWIDQGTITPTIVYGEYLDDPPPWIVTWFNGPDAGLFPKWDGFRIVYAGGAYQDEGEFGTEWYVVETQDPTGQTPTTDGSLWGVGVVGRATQEEAEHDTYAQWPNAGVGSLTEKR